MALNKKQTSMTVKVVIVVVIVAFVISLGGVFANLTNTSVPTQSATGSTALDQITATFKPNIDANELTLKDRPKDYALLVQLANDYSDWAVKVSQLQGNTQAQQLAPGLWRSAGVYYGRALAVKPGDPSVSTDYAISAFYSGDATRAITIVEGVTKKAPKFAQAWYNAGIFYAQTNQNTKAAAAWNTYLKLDPNGPSAANAQKFLSQLNAGAAQGSGTTTP